MKTTLVAAALFILIAGLASGATVYFIAEDPEPTAYVIVGDTAYGMDATATKAYVRQLERFGGKAAVLFDDFNRWFASRWQGKTLGITIGALSLLAALVLLAIAKRR